MHKALPLFLLGAACSIAARAQQDVSALVAKITQSTVLIICRNDVDGAVTVGSGFVADTLGDVVTNWHVVEDASSITIKSSDVDSVTVYRPTVVDTTADLALLAAWLSSTSHPRIRMKDGLPKPGQNILVVGNPLGLTETVSTGIVSAVRTDEYGIPVIQITAPISHGSSGSPVLDMSGKLVGVARSSVTAGQNINFAIPASLVSELVSHRDDPNPAWHQEPNPRAKAFARQLATASADLESGRFADALTGFESAVLLNGSDASAHYGLGRACFELKQFTRAIDQFQHARFLSASKKQASLACSESGRAYAQLRQLDDAVTTFRTAISLDADNEAAHYYLGVLLASRERYDEAWQEYRYLRGANSPNAEKLRLAIEAFRLDR